MVIFVNAVQVLKKAYKSSSTNNCTYEKRSVYLRSILTVYAVTVSAGMYWTVFECGLGLIAACMPAIYVLLKRFLKHLGLIKPTPGASWTWRSVRAHSKKYRNMDSTTVELETVPVDTLASINTEVTKDLDKSHYPALTNGQREGIVVHKSISRVERGI
jgi:hypothetical protein